MIGVSAKSLDWRTVSPEAIGCEVDDIAGKLTMCLHDLYFDRVGDPVAWIESVTAECREKLAPLFQFTVGERAFLDGVLDRGEIDASPMGVPESVRAAIEACPALRWKAQNVKAWKSGDESLVPRVRRGRRPPGNLLYESLFYEDRAEGGDVSKTIWRWAVAPRLRTNFGRSRRLRKTSRPFSLQMRRSGKSFEAALRIS